MKLDDVADIQMGYQAREKIAGSANSQYYVILGKDIGKDNEIDTSNLTGIQPEGELERYLVHRGDILFMAKGSYNYAACIKTDMGNTVASGSFYILRIKVANLEPCYLSWWLNQHTVQEHFHQTQTSGGTISYISTEALRKAPVLVPNLVTQRKIIALSETYRTMKTKTTELLNLQEKLINQIAYQAIGQKENA